MKERKENQSRQAQTAGSHPFPGVKPARGWWNSLNWWPALAGIGLAGFIALDMPSGGELTAILAASGLVYLGAAVLCKPSAAWPLFFGTFVVITAGKIGIRAFDATCIFLGLAALFAAYGLLRGAAHPIGGLPLQAIAMAAFGTVAAIALIVSGTAGAYLVATGLLAHAAWTFITTGATKLWSARWPSSAVSWTRCLPWRL